MKKPKTLKTLASAMLMCGILWSIFFTGCADVMFEPKPLEMQARGITLAKGTPYNCKILGEVEGKDSPEQRVGATREKLRESAMNELRNEAYYAMGENKRAILHITKEIVLCTKWVGGSLSGSLKTVDCTNETSTYNIMSYRIHAQVFDCGER